MKLRYCIVLFVIIELIIICACDEDSNPAIPSDREQVVTAFAFYDTSYWDADGDSMARGPNVGLNGSVLADPMPRFDYCSIGDTVFEGPAYYDYIEGAIQFGAWPAVFETLETASVEVKTSSGIVSGSIDMPGPIGDYNASCGETLSLGGPLELAWNGDADFYQISVNYSYAVPDTVGYDWEYLRLDTLIVATEYSVPGSVFAYSGRITYSRIYPVNGPYPIPGAQSNMSGSGSGFLYYYDYSQSPSIEIVVGSGYPVEAGLPDERHPIYREIRRVIIEKLDGNPATESNL